MQSITKVFLLFVVFESIPSLIAARPKGGANGVSSFVLGGDDADNDEFPYFAHLSFCGGALIADDIVLTAAHCNLFNRSGFQVILNAFSQGVIGQGIERYCSEWVSHPEYDDYELYNDYALCKLDRPVDIDDSKVRLELNEENSAPSGGENLVVLGLSYDSNNFTEPDVLQKLIVPALDDQDCRDLGGFYEDITENMFCAGGVPGEDICSGDSGGPIVRRTPQKDGIFLDTHVGLVSWGRPDGPVCGYNSTRYGPAATVYARTSTRIDWIRRTSCDLDSRAVWCSGSGNPPSVPCNGREMLFELDMAAGVTLNSTDFDDNYDLVEGEFVYNLTRIDGLLEVTTETMDFHRAYNDGDYAYSKAYCLEYDTEYTIIVASKSMLDYRFHLEGDLIFSGRGDNLQSFTVPSPSQQPSNRPSDSPSGRPSKMPKKKKLKKSKNTKKNRKSNKNN